MPLTLTTPPVAEPISVDEVKAHSRIDATTEDGDILQLIKAAREHVEGYTRRSLITATFDWRLDAFPECFHFPRSPVATVDAFEYVDSGGTTRTLSSSDYQLDIYSEPARMLPAYGTTWPSTRDQLNAVRVRFTAGHGANGTAIPKAVRTALLMIVDDLYEHRGAMTEIGGGFSVEANPTLVRLLWPYRIWT